MRLVSCHEMREMEAQAMNLFGLDGEVLMQNAALAVVRILKAQWGPGLARAAIFCGKGNNAGDGWAVAEILVSEGWTVKVFHPGRETALPQAAAYFRKKAIDASVPEGSWHAGIEELDAFDLVIDALLGTGIRGLIDGGLGDVIEAINRSGLPVLAVDVPSGVSGDTGQIAGMAVKASWTVTFGCAKLGLAVFPGREMAGQVTVDPIGLPESLLQMGDSFMISAQTVAEKLPRRPLDSHKGCNGHLLVIGGYEGMTGAPVLSGIAGLRSGAGLVTLGRRPGLSIPEKPPELMTVIWSEIQWDRYDSIVCGPGLSLAADGMAVLKQVLEQDSIPRVIDADGLNLLARMGPESFKDRSNIVLTPHPGEMARLCGLSVAQVQSDRIGLARAMARDWNVTLVLKGAATLVATAKGRLWVNPTGNPGLATAGTGDVLAGVIGAMLAQGLTAEYAAAAGVYFHGKAGDMAADEFGEIGLMAGDLLPRLPQAIRSVMPGGTL